MDCHQMNKPAEALKSGILESLKAFDKTSLRISTTKLFETLGYMSEKSFDLSPNTPKNFLQNFDARERFRKDKGLFSKWKSGKAKV